MGGPQQVRRARPPAQHRGEELEERGDQESDGPLHGNGGGDVLRRNWKALAQGLGGAQSFRHSTKEVAGQGQDFKVQVCLSQKQKRAVVENKVFGGCIFLPI